MLPVLDDYDWESAFKEALGNLNRPPGSSVSLEPFDREDVALIDHMDEGERDGADWIMTGRLKDGRWFVVRAGCDYTGWD